jgi:hypothetical protein
MNGQNSGTICPPVLGEQNRVEPKRVVYVGVTRVEKLLAIAVPAPFVTRISAIMVANKVPFEIHDLTVQLATEPA